MASIVERPRKNGEITYTVRWRDRLTASMIPLLPPIATTSRHLSGSSMRTASPSMSRSVSSSSRSHLPPRLARLSSDTLGYSRTSASAPRPSTGPTFGFTCRTNWGIELFMASSTTTSWPGSSGCRRRQVQENHRERPWVAVRGVVDGRPSEAASGQPVKGCHPVEDGHIVEPVTFLAHEEFRLLMRFAHPHCVPLFRFLVATGLRMGEASTLLATNFDLDSATPSVRISKRGSRTGPAGTSWARLRRAGRGGRWLWRRTQSPLCRR